VVQRNKGYGFIQRSSGEDVFVHFSAIQENGYKTLNEGDAVEFVCQQGPKGLNAADVSSRHLIEFPQSSLKGPSIRVQISCDFHGHETGFSRTTCSLQTQPIFLDAWSFSSAQRAALRSPSSAAVAHSSSCAMPRLCPLFPIAIARFRRNP